LERDPAADVVGVSDGVGFIAAFRAYEDAELFVRSKNLERDPKRIRTSDDPELLDTELGHLSRHRRPDAVKLPHREHLDEGWPHFRRDHEQPVRLR
jgi:hypothetical protein